MDRPAMSDGLRAKQDEAVSILTAFGRTLVAFSGGVDSTLLAVMAREALGRANVLAVTADSPSLSRQDLQEAIRLAGQLDLPHRVVATREVSDPVYRSNTTARCYLCKHVLFEELEALAARERIAVVLYGAIGDDLAAERPGQRAARERGVRAPLQEAGLEKWEVRALARQLGLPNWDRPQNACLSSRVPHGLEVTEEKLSQIERGEQFLRRLGFVQVRVRHLGVHARIEVAQDVVPRFRDAELRARVARHFRDLGFQSAGVDQAGYRPGAADDASVDELPVFVTANAAV